MRAQSRSSKKFVVLATLAIVCVFSGTTMAANKLIVKGTDGTTDKFVVTDGGNVGIGTNNPGMAVTISKPGTTGETSMMFHNSGGLPYGQYNSGAFFFMRNNDSTVNGGLPLNGDRIGSMSYGSITSAGYKYGANISALSSGNWSTTSFPAYLSFQTTGIAGTAPTERMRINSEGSVGIGTSSPSQKLEINGGVRLNTSTTKPECTTSIRGTIWFTQGTTDTIEVCAQVSGGSPIWRTITLQ